MHACFLGSDRWWNGWTIHPVLAYVAEFAHHAAKECQTYTGDSRARGNGGGVRS